MGQAGPEPCSATGNGMCWILLWIPTEPWCLGLELEPHGCPRSVGCQRCPCSGGAKWGNGPGGGRAGEWQFEFGAVLSLPISHGQEPSPGPGWGCHSLFSMWNGQAEDSTKFTPEQPNSRDWDGKFGQTGTYQGCVKHKAQRVWAVLPRLLWCLGIHRGTPRLGQPRSRGWIHLSECVRVFTGV